MSQNGVFLIMTGRPYSVQLNKYLGPSPGISTYDAQYQANVPIGDGSKGFVSVGNSNADKNGIYGLAQVIGGYKVLEVVK